MLRGEKRTRNVTKRFLIETPFARSYHTGPTQERAFDAWRRSLVRETRERIESMSYRWVGGGGGGGVGRSGWLI